MNKKFKKNSLLLVTLVICSLIALSGCKLVKDECSTNNDCKTKYESCVTFCGINKLGNKECYFTGSLKPNQKPYEYPECTSQCESGYEWVNSECKLIDTILTYTNNEPIITNDDEVRNLYETEKIMVFINPLDSDNIFYDKLSLERYCTKGVLVDSGCKYDVNLESECIADPDAPNNGVTFNPEDMTCITHYIHTRANIKCLVTGEIYDYNDLSGREQLKRCPNCDWFYNYVPSMANKYGTELKQETVMGVKLYILDMGENGEPAGFAWFCTKNTFKAGNKIDIINYLNKYITTS